MSQSKVETGRQLLLFPQMGTGPSFASFRTDCLTLVVETCQALAFGMRSGYAVLYGPPGSGKSHLLRAACQAWTGRGGQAALWTPDPCESPPEPGGSLPYEFLAIESLDLVAGDSELERACFGFVLAAQQGRLRLLLAARTPPAALPWKLPDLASRLVAMTLPGLTPVAESLWPEILESRCEERGMRLETAASRWLMQHGPRRLETLLGVVDALADRGGAVGRKITIPRIRRMVLQKHPATSSPSGLR
jgi:DnaA family protein